MCTQCNARQKLGWVKPGEEQIPSKDEGTTFMESAFIFEWGGLVWVNKAGLDRINARRRAKGLPEIPSDAFTNGGASSIWIIEVGKNKEGYNTGARFYNYVEQACVLASSILLLY